MDHDRLKLVLKIWLVAIVDRDVGVKSILGDLDGIFSLSYTLRYEQARRNKFSHIEG